MHDTSHKYGHKNLDLPTTIRVGPIKLSKNNDKRAGPNRHIWNKFVQKYF